MLKAAIYARYSSSGQRPTSIEDQVARCRAAAARFGCAVANGHVYSDPQVSGAVAERPGYQALLKAAKDRAFDAVLVEAQDRLWRDQAEMHAALKRLRHWGAKVFSIETGADLTDRAGSIVAAVQGWQAEAFLDNLREKTRRGMEGTVRRGLSPGGRAYGYRSEPVTDQARKDSYGQPEVVGYRRAIDKEEAKVVRRIFEMYADGISPKSIAYRFNEERVPPPRWRRGALNRGWTKSTIHGSSKKATGILNNPLYVGRVVWNKRQKVRDPETGRQITRRRDKSEWVHADVPELRIVTDDLWKRVQARRKAVRETFSRRHRQLCGHPHRYLLSGLLVCGACGAHYVAKTRGYYGCASSINRGSAICKNTRLTRRDVVEERILRHMEEHVFSPTAVDYLTRQVNAALARLQTAGNGQRKRSERDLAQAKKELENIKAAIRQGMVTPTTRAMLEEAEARIAQLEAAQLPDVSAGKVAVLPSVINGYLKDLRRVLWRDTERARAILRDLLGEITLEPDDKGLVAVLRGNVPAILGLPFDNGGAGRGI